jgi:hypothetical protein
VGPSYLSFSVTDRQRFGQLEKVVSALAAARSSGEWQSEDYWLGFFDEGAKAKFWWPTPAEAEEWRVRWFSTPLPQRWTEPSLRHGWHFSSMIEAFSNLECKLLGCRLVDPSEARFEFVPEAFPYGGTGCMVALIEAFGFQVASEFGT